MIPYVDLGAEATASLEPFLRDLRATIATGHFILGEVVTRFETEFARRQSVEHAIGVNSGLDALWLSLLALGIGPGDEVITAPNSFVATAAAIAHTGARVVFADVDAHRNLDPVHVERSITSKTKAIIPVHLTGICASMNELVDIAAARGIAVVEDCAQAVGSTYQGRPVGSLGRVGCFSLHPLKNLPAMGDGGCIVTNDAELAHRIRLLRNHGLVDRNTTLMWGYNSRLDSIQALWLLHKFQVLDGLLARRRLIADRYLRELADLQAVELPAVPRNTSASWHAFVIQLDQRDAMQQHLLNSGVQSLIHYPVPIHLQPAATSLGYAQGHLTTCETQASRILSLPVRDSLTNAEVDHVIRSVRSYFPTAGGMT